MKSIYSPCPACLRVGTIPMLSECTLKEAKTYLKTSEDPHITEEPTVFVFPCRICGDQYIPHTYKQLISKLPTLLKNAKIVDKGGLI